MSGQGQRLPGAEDRREAVAPCYARGRGGEGGEKVRLLAVRASRQASVICRALLELRPWGGPWSRARPGIAGAARRRPYARTALDSHAIGHLAFFGGDLHAFDQRRVLGFAPVRLHVAVAIGVEDAELHRVHTDEMRRACPSGIRSAKSIAVTPKPRIAVAGVRLVKTQ
jgi:hypothetical protein